ncbi:hypothetical protein VNO77_27520 [Canavalia gladiata]|uniref:Secreted protein n=1 Tax=Canavalia gladiata TaxID=3824 RepID=A0AAN9KUX6_CANGL
MQPQASCLNLVQGFFLLILARGPGFVVPTTSPSGVHSTIVNTQLCPRPQFLRLIKKPSLKNKESRGYSLESWLRWELKRLIRQEIDLNQGRRKAGEVAISVSNINSGLVVRQISDQSILHSARVDLLRICWGSYGGHLHQGYPCIRMHGRANNRGDITDVRGWLGSRHGKHRQKKCSSLFQRQRSPISRIRAARWLCFEVIRK